MSKSILSVVIDIAAVALMFVPGVGQAIGLGAVAFSIGGTAVTAAMILGAGLMVADSLLLGPSAPHIGDTQTAMQRLYASLVTTEPRKWWLGGPTAGATDIRYQTYTGSSQEYYHEIIAHASHQVHSIDEIWIDNEQAWTAAGGVQGRYVGWLTVQTVLVGTSSNGIAIDSVWTSSCTLTGCAYSYLKYKLLDPSNSSNQSPFSSGVSGRLTIRGKGAFIYDPRLDSTVTGGSGSQRAGTQSTWAWDDNASRNPALQLLWYLLGWQINGKLALGMGLPSARIDLASFITAANHCDESVALNGGGSEPRYRSDGVISEGDDRSTVIRNLCQAMNGALRDNGGKISLQILLNDLAAPVASFNATSGIGDILGSEQYEQTQALNNYFNIARGRFVDPSNSALYQLSDFPQIALTSPDGIDRIQTIDFPLVQSVSQAQRLAKLLVKRAQYQARYTAQFGANAWAASLGNIVQLTHAGMNWTNKLFRVVSHAISQTGSVTMTLLEENTDTYSWAAEDIAGIVGGTPTVVDPTLTPVLESIGAASSSLKITTPATVYADSTGTPKSGQLPLPIDCEFVRNGVNQTSGVTWSASLVSGNATFTISGTGAGALSITGPTDSTFAAQSIIQVTGVCSGATRTLNVTINRQDDPPTSSGGTGASSASTTTLGATTGTAYDTTNAVSATLTATAGSAGQVALTAPLGFRRTGVNTTSGPTGETGAAGKWQWLNGSTWTDVATEVTNSGDSITSGPDDTGRYITTAGSLSVSQTKTGLTNGTAYQFRFLWRRIDVTSTAENVTRSSGTLQAVGS